MRYKIIAVLVLIMGMCRSVYAEEEQPKGPVDVTSETAVSILQKANALLTGNLEITMEEDRDKYNKDNYTVNALGERVPKSTPVRKRKKGD